MSYKHHQDGFGWIIDRSFLARNRHLTTIETTTFMRISSRLPSARVGKGGKMVLSDQQQGGHTDSSYAKVQTGHGAGFLIR